MMSGIGRNKVSAVLYPLDLLFEFNLFRDNLCYLVGVVNIHVGFMNAVL